MPKRTSRRVFWSPEHQSYLLSTADLHKILLSESKDAWLRWLGEHRSFAFDGRSGHLNLLKERRGPNNDGYWYAYQRTKSGMFKRYLGRDQQVHLADLETLATSLNQPGLDLSEQNPTPKRISESASLAISPLLMPKLQLPRVQSSLLPRAHLLDLLDHGLEHRLILIAGPAGYGKTTLVVQWITDRSTSAAFPWVTSLNLDEEDNDPIRFWRYMIAACQRLNPDIGQEALDLLLAHRLPPFKPLTLMLTSLINDLSRLEHPCMLILDDLHVLDHPQVIQTLLFFLDHLPNSLYMVILVRGDPPFSVARLRAHNAIFDIYPPHLGFSFEETQAFFEQKLPFTLSTKVLRQIHERMDGWPAGLRLFERELHWSNNTQDIEQRLSAFTGGYWSIQEYFLTEILQTLPQDQQEFLLQSTGLPRINAPLCDAIMERTDSVQQIAALRGSDLFLIPLDGRGNWSRYHSLFAEAVQREAYRRLGEDRLRQIALQASLWYEAYDLLEEAIETALSAVHLTRAVSLLKRLITDRRLGNVFSQPELYRLYGWLNNLPQSDLEAQPDLCLQYALILLYVMMDNLPDLNKKEKILHLLQVAEQQWRDTNNMAKLAEVFAFHALLARQEGKMLQAVTWAKQSLAWLPPDEKSWRNLSLTVVGMGEAVDGDLSIARETLFEALRVCEQIGNWVYLRAIKGMLSWVYLEAGELQHAYEQFRTIQAEARIQEDYDDISRTQLGMAQIFYEWNMLGEAQQAAEEGLKIGEQMQIEEIRARAAIRLALIEAASGQAAEAQKRLLRWQARASMPTTPIAYQLSREIEITLLLLQIGSGETAIAERWFLQNASQATTLPLNHQQRERLLQSRLLLHQHQVLPAIALLEDLFGEVSRSHHLYFKLQIQVVLLRAYTQQGLTPKARKHLREVLTAARGENYLRLFLDEGFEMQKILQHMLPYLHQSDSLTYVEAILKAFTHEPTAFKNGPAIAIRSAPLFLSPQERRVLRLLAAGNTNHEIAQELVVSVNTVRTQVQSIYRKLDVKNRIEASAAAKRLTLN